MATALASCTCNKHRCPNPPCHAAYQRAYRAAHIEKCREYVRKSYRKADGYYLRRFGITKLQYQTRLDEQHGVCMICEQPETIVDSRHRLLRMLAVDHDAKTGRIRGLLCFKCNVALGFLQHNPDILMQAIRYLTQVD